MVTHIGALLIKYRIYRPWRNKTDKHPLDNTKGALHELNQMVNPRVNHLVKCRRVARDPNPRLKLT